MVCPKSTLPVRMRIVLSAWISNHELESLASSEFLPVAVAAAAFASHALLPTRPKPTMRAPPVLTNWRRVSVAPYASDRGLLTVAMAYLAFAIRIAARCTASRMAV